MTIQRILSPEVLIAHVALQLRPDWLPVTFRVFPGGHSLRDLHEQQDAIHWFLGLPDTTSGATGAVAG